MCIHHNVPEPNEDEIGNYDFGIYGVNIENDDDDNRNNVDLVAARRLQRRIINNNFL